MKRKEGEGREREGEREDRITYELMPMQMHRMNSNIQTINN